MAGYKPLTHLNGSNQEDVMDVLLLQIDVFVQYLYTIPQFSVYYTWSLANLSFRVA